MPRSREVKGREAAQGIRAATPRSVLPLPDPFPLYRGGVLRGAHIAYESWG